MLTSTPPPRTRACAIAIAVALLGRKVAAQAVNAVTPGAVLTLLGAIEYAVLHYRMIKAAMEESNVALAEVSVAKATYLPRLDSLWQSNRATVNNITGLLLPQSVLSPISGPPLASASNGSVWGSATGALSSWEPVDFGLRGASVHSAQAAVARAHADESLTASRSRVLSARRSSRWSRPSGRLRPRKPTSSAG
jgi:outer membrane protein TolC